MRCLTAIAFALLLAAARPASAQEAEGAFLGISPAPLGPETRAAYSIPDEVSAGVVLMEITPGSAAAKAGFRPGDVLVSFDGKAIGTVDELIAAVRAHKPGDLVAYTLRRGSGTIHGKLTLGRRPPEIAEEEKTEKAGPHDELAERLERARREVHELKQKLLKHQGAPHGRRVMRFGSGGIPGLEGWIAKEERALEEARKAGNAEKVRWHTARLSILREMKKGAPAGPVVLARSGAKQVRVQMAPDTGAPSLQRIERKLDAILKLLRKLEKERE